MNAIDPTIVVGAELWTRNPVRTRQKQSRTDAATGRDRSDQDAALAVLAAIIEAISALDDVQSIDDAGAKLARLLSDFLSGRVVVLWRNREHRSLRIVGDSWQSGDQPNDKEQRLLMLAAAEEVAARGQLTRWPARSDSTRHSLLAIEQLAARESMQRLVAVNLQDSAGNARGTVLAIDPQHASTEKFLNTLAAPLASRLHGLERAAPGRLETKIRALHQSLRRIRREFLLTGVVLAMAVLLFPARYRIGVDLELQPVQQRFVAAPFDGPLQSAYVRPGDVVAEGDLLATIDPREIEFELAGIRADLRKASQQKKGLMAEHDVAGSRIAAYEYDRLKLQTDLLNYRRDNLEIRSPISGVVVSGDHKESEGIPMSRGETMFEIAPLGRFVVEIAIPERDLSHVRIGMPVSFYLNAMPNKSFAGKIQQVHPRAEVRDHSNVFVAEVHVEDPENLLRPGMQGRGKIRGDRHPLCWNLFHHSADAVRRSMGW